MSDDEMAADFVAHGMRWEPGMLAVAPEGEMCRLVLGVPALLVCGSVRWPVPGTRFSAWTDNRRDLAPDVTDPATVGLILAQLRERCDEAIYVQQYEDGRWSVWYVHDAYGPDGAQGHPTEIAAIHAAWMAVTSDK